jgi:transposase
MNPDKDTSMPTPHRPTSPDANNKLAVRLVSDELWALAAPLVAARSGLGIAGRVDDRTVFTAAIYTITSGSSWRTLPTWLGVNPATVYGRFRDWCATDIWTTLAHHATHTPEQPWATTIAHAATTRTPKSRTRHYSPPSLTDDTINARDALNRHEGCAP